jgi:hypothetical protein
MPGLDPRIGRMGWRWRVALEFQGRPTAGRDFYGEWTTTPTFGGDTLAKGRVAPPERTDMKREIALLILGAVLVVGAPASARFDGYRHISVDFSGASCGYLQDDVPDGPAYSVGIYGYIHAFEDRRDVHRIALLTEAYRRRIGGDAGFRPIKGSVYYDHASTRTRHHVEFGPLNEDGSWNIYHPRRGFQYMFRAAIQWRGDEPIAAATRYWYFDPVEHCVRRRDL